MCVLHTSQLCRIRSRIMNLGTTRRVGSPTNQPVSQPTSQPASQPSQPDSHSPTYTMFMTLNGETRLPANYENNVSRSRRLLFLLDCEHKPTINRANTCSKQTSGLSRNNNRVTPAITWRFTGSRAFIQFRATSAALCAISESIDFAPAHPVSAYNIASAHAE